jgi:hypothetical protein
VLKVLSVRENTLHLNETRGDGNVNIGFEGSWQKVSPLICCGRSAKGTSEPDKRLLWDIRNDHYQAES